MGDVVSYVDLHRPNQRGRCGSSGFLPHPPEPEQSLAVVTDRRGESDDPAAASGLLHTLRAGRLDAPMLAPGEPRWAQLRFAAAPGLDIECRAFCWPLEFPDVFFEPSDNGQGARPRGHPGFDAMIGNPPWEKIKPAKKEFYAHADPAIRDYQGQSLTRRITELHRDQPDLVDAWVAYESHEKRYAGTLLKGGMYQHQIAEVRGEKTGGHPDLFKFFLERNHQLTRIVGRVGMLLPA